MAVVSLVWVKGKGPLSVFGPPGGPPFRHGGGPRGGWERWFLAKPPLSGVWEAFFTRVFGQERDQPWAAAGVVYSMRSECGLELRYSVLWLGGRSDDF